MHKGCKPSTGCASPASSASTVSSANGAMAINSGDCGTGGGSRPAAQGEKRSELMILRRGVPCFVERRLIVVARNGRLVPVWIESICTVPQSKVAAAVKHIEIEPCPVLEHPAQIAYLHVIVQLRTRLAPMIEPSRPIFTANQRRLRTECAQLGHLGARVAGRKRKRGRNAF